MAQSYNRNSFVISIYHKIILFFDKMILQYWYFNNIYKRKDPVLFSAIQNIFATSKNPIGFMAKKSKSELRMQIDAILPPMLSAHNRSLTTKIYWILNGLRNFPRCHTCLERKTFLYRDVQNIRIGYLPHCSLSCSCNDPKVLKKHQNTTLKRFGTRWPMQSSEVLDRSKRSCKEKYGVNNVSQSDAIKQQKLITTMKNFGKDNLFNRKKAAKTQVNATNAQKMKKLQKFKQTNIKRLGVAFPTQSHSVISKQRGSYHLDGKMFKSSWELAKYIWHRDRKDDFEYLPNVAFEYMQTDGKLHKYFPDFRVGDHYEEVKGNQFIRKDGTMYIPYKKKTWSTKKYEEVCENYEHKRKCMLENNVAILSESDIRPYLQYVNATYGKNFMHECKIFSQKCK